MQSLLITAMIASLATLSRATRAEKRQVESVSISFYPPSGESWSQTFPTDMSSQDIQVKNTVSHIYNPGGATCFFSGTQDNWIQVPIGDHQLETPQSLKTGRCAHL